MNEPRVIGARRYLVTAPSGLEGEDALMKAWKATHQTAWWITETQEQGECTWEVRVGRTWVAFEGTLKSFVNDGLPLTLELSRADQGEMPELVAGDPRAGRQAAKDPGGLNG